MRIASPGKARMSVLGLAAVGAAAAFLIAGSSHGQARRDASAFRFNAAGELERPQNYRRWVYVGTPVTPNDMNDGKAAFPEFHNVYIDPASYEHYLRTGDFRDGAILVKELVSVGTQQAVSGNGYFEGEFIGLEAAVKSSRHLGDEPGDWGYFSFTNEQTLGGPLKRAAAAFPAASCNACHEASAGDDWVFTQYYPVLRAAKGAGRAPENAPERPKTLSMGGGEREFDQSGRDQTWRASAPTPAAAPGEIPLDEDALLAYLRGREYLAFRSRESEKHPSRGPHREFRWPVRVYMNDTLAASMEAGNAEHPEGSGVVKEMYTADGSELTGWAVSVKTRPTTDGGKGWFWYEVIDEEIGDPSVFAIGNGVEGCYACHARGGVDMVLTTWPLE
jgi:cytochrome c553